MINETVNVDDILDNGYIHCTMCSISIVCKGSKEVVMRVNLKTNEIVYDVYMGSDLLDTEKSLKDAVHYFNQLKL